MNKSRFFITTGAILLGAVGIFGTKAAKKGQITGAKFQQITGSITGLPGANFTDTKGTAGRTVLLVTATNKSIISTLVTSASSVPVHPVYYH